MTKITTFDDLLDIESTELRRLATIYPLYLATACNHVASARDELILSKTTSRNKGQHAKLAQQYLNRAKQAYNRAREVEATQLVHVRAKMADLDDTIKVLGG